MTFTEEDIYKIYSLCYKTSLSKGKIKQHTLNQIVIESIMRKNEDNITFKKESKIECNWGKRFNADVVKYKNNLVEEIVLIKAPASNVAQNHVNSLNSKAGEFQRIKSNVYKGSKIRQISFIPNVTPFFSKNEKIKSFEKNKSFFITKCDILCHMDIKEVYITFDIEGIENCKTKQDVHNLFINNNPITNIVIETSDYISNV
jgi:hypothetical protein